jgi:hypothetical protein
LIFVLVEREASSRISGIFGGLTRTRADMEYATSKRQSLGAAGELPGLLTAFNEAGAALSAMRGDQSLGLAVVGLKEKSC